MDYPVWDVAIGGSMLMAVVAITHVIVSHFAVGGGLVLAVTETLAVKRNDPHLRELARRSALVLILVSTVFGAISGVGIWVVAGLISPAAIATLIRNYVWGWAIEWVFFIVELLAALLYFATWQKITKQAHLALIWIYFIAAYASLVVINGIITFMLTPGQWLTTRAFWDGFFNPTYWPGLVLRTGIALLMATSFMLIPATRLAPAARPRIARYLGLWLLAGAVIAYAGFRWWEGALPDTVRALFLGAAPKLATLAATRHFLLWALTATLGLGVVFLLAVPRAARLAPALLIMLAAFAFFGGYERLREGVRKPFLIHDYMFSNGVRVDEITALNTNGILGRAGFGAAAVAADPAVQGREVYRAQCASCHTIDGYQGIRKLLPDDAGMIAGVLGVMRAQGETIAALPPGQPIDKSQLDYPFMPPFVGTEAELESLAQYLAGLAAAPGAALAGTDAALAERGGPQ